VIALEQVSKQYGGEYLFRDLSLRLGDDERVALVGPNGAGKSTLMKVVLGEIEPDGGRIVRSRTNTTGYLPQDGVSHSGRTLFQEASTAFQDILDLHRRAEELAAEIEARHRTSGPSPALDELVEELGRVQHHLEHLDGYAFESRVEAVLSGLGFACRDFARPCEEFSGGWQMRIALAKLLLREPTILMLDEPTNHLDIESLEWLEEYLKGYQGSVVLISHDRRFLDTMVTRTLELTRGGLDEYRGNFSWYLEEKERRLEILLAQYENQQEHIKSAMRFVERFRYQATKARQVQSRLKRLEKMERIELDDAEEYISFDFPEPPQPGRVLMRLEGVAKSYGDLSVFRDLSLTLERGDRMAFLGANGAGKSTLARIVAGTETLTAGTRQLGHHVAISYFAQNQAEELDPSLTVLETLERTAPTESPSRLRTLLGCFLFVKDDVFKRVKVLSGGEKSRLALAKMLLVPANLLVLDEPTNHLDMRSKEVLQEALRRFGGSYLIVSHDRDFLAPLINKVLEFGRSGVALHLGTVGEWLDRVHRRKEEERERERRAAAARKAPPPPPPGPAAPPPSETPGKAALPDKERRRREAEARQAHYRRHRPLLEKLKKLEKEIARQEERKAETERALASDLTCRDPAAARTLSCDYREVTTSLAYLYDEWTTLQEELEALEKGAPAS
jgi:ATP-binding cassette subfamily F protein 3